MWGQRQRILGDKSRISLRDVLMQNNPFWGDMGRVFVGSRVLPKGGVRLQSQ